MLQPRFQRCLLHQSWLPTSLGSRSMLFLAQSHSMRFHQLLQAFHSQRSDQ